MVKYLSLFVCVSVIGLLLGGLSWVCAEEVDYKVCIVRNDFTKVKLSRYIQVLPCESKPSLARVMRDSVNYPFRQNFQDFLQFPSDKIESAYWVMFKIKNEDTERKKLLLELDNPLLGEVEFFETSDKIDAHAHTGSRFDFSTRPLNHRNFVFRVTLLPQEEKVYYLYIYHKGLPAYIPVTLYSAEAFAEAQYLQQLGIGFVLGFWLFLLGLVIWLRVQVGQGLYGHFAFYLLSLGLWWMAQIGIGEQFLWYFVLEWGESMAGIWALWNVYFIWRLLYFFAQQQGRLVYLRSLFNIISRITFCLVLIGMILLYFKSTWQYLWLGSLTHFYFNATHIVLLLFTIYGQLRNTQADRHISLILLIGLLLLGAYFYFITPSEAHNPFTTPFTLYAFIAVSLNTFVVISHRLRILKNEEELAKLVSVTKLKTAQAEY
jgi:hypothetical protein